MLCSATRRRLAYSTVTLQVLPDAIMQNAYSNKEVESLAPLPISCTVKCQGPLMLAGLLRPACKPPCAHGPQLDHAPTPGPDARRHTTEADMPSLPVSCAACCQKRLNKKHAMAHARVAYMGT